MHLQYNELDFEYCNDSQSKVTFEVINDLFIQKIAISISTSVARRPVFPGTSRILGIF